MLSLLTKLKNRLRETFKSTTLYKKGILRARIMDTDTDTATDTDTHTDIKHNDHENLSVNTPSSVFFNIKIADSEIKNDYELQELLTTMRRARIDVTNLILEPRIEEMIEKIPNATSIMKVKLRILYIIIALDIYSTLFEEKKHYKSIRTSRYLGVFHYKDYIIRIDDSPYSFINESDVADALNITSASNYELVEKCSGIVMPFLIYTNIRRDDNNNICECSPRVVCQCKYNDNAGSHPGMNHLHPDAMICYNRMRKDAISFSIQYYVKNAVTLYNWVRDNMGTYNQFSTIQYPFFIHLFHQCAQLFQILHAAGIVHGDVKPDNILIREDYDFNLYNTEKCKHFTVYLIDFGLSGLQGKGYGTGGTIPYCHPEFKNIQDTNRASKYNWKKLEAKHDIWSLGIGFLTLYIYRDYYNYYHKYPKYFFTKTGYVSSLILDVISDTKLNALFTKMMSEDCIPISEVCDMLKDMTD